LSTPDNVDRKLSDLAVGTVRSFLAGHIQNWRGANQPHRGLPVHRRRRAISFNRLLAEKRHVLVGEPVQRPRLQILVPDLGSAVLADLADRERNRCAIAPWKLRRPLLSKDNALDGIFKRIKPTSSILPNRRKWEMGNRPLRYICV